ncbi:membrane protein insertase YidC [Azospira sp. I13]|uniref:membrane protein insertase YidC n=1 Tax=Azospira sp. I13 TaxID=1765050 RepID=UPI000D46F36F|nr:membrane protein insertase YidC [Azospira sp. I13]GBG02314.1 membrane protein insertase YidC [Azospira sp. I13]
MDNRRLFLFIIFSVSIIMLWDAWVKHNQPKDAPAAVAAAAQQGAAPTPSAALNAGAAAVPGAALPAPVKAETVTVRTDLMVAEISTLGGDLVRLELPAYKSAVDAEKPFVLFGEEHRYSAQTGLIGDGLPNHKSAFKLLPGALELGDKDQLQVRLQAVADGVKVTKVYTFHKGSFLVDVGYEIENGGAKAITPHAYFQLARDEKAPEGESSMVSVFTGPALYTEQEKFHKIAFSDIEKGKAKVPQNPDNGWVAMVQHYFVSAFVPQGTSPREFFVRKVEAPADGKPGVYSAGVIVPVAQIEAGAKGGVTVPLFAGPQIQSQLKQVAPGLDLVVDYGWLTVIAAPIFWALEWIHKLVGNWGWAIVVLTIALKLIFFPLSAASYKSMAKMRQVTPRLQHIKEHFANDRQRMNQEMMELYRKEKINPLGGCLPILIQIPVFIALYWVLLGAVEMRSAPWVGWIHDLSAPDSLFGVIPGIHMPVGLLPILMVATMFIQTKLNPTPPDPMQAKMMLMMPFMFGFMFFFFPSGLVLYWVVNNVLSIAQQWQITRMIEQGGKAANDAKA